MTGDSEKVYVAGYYPDKRIPGQPDAVVTDYVAESALGSLASAAKLIIGEVLTHPSRRASLLMYSRDDSPPAIIPGPDNLKEKIVRRGPLPDERPKGPNGSGPVTQTIPTHREEEIAKAPSVNIDLSLSYSRVASSLSFFRDLRPRHIVGHPPLGESVKLVELCLGVGFRCVAHVDPVDQKLLDLVTGQVRILFMDALNGSLKIEPVRIRPDELALLGVDLHVLEQIIEDVADLGP